MVLEESKHFESLYPDNTREVEVAKIMEYVKAGKSCQVIGIPGMGRSNLLGLLSYNKNVRLKHLGANAKWFHFVYMDFSEIKKHKFFDILKFMLISTAYSLSERGLTQEYETVNQYLKEAIGFADELILFQALKRSIDYLAVEKELTVIFLFDRFEQALPEIDEEFFLDLKILRNRAKFRFSVIFSLTRPLEDILETNIYSEFYEFFGGNDIYLEMYDPKGMAFRFGYLEKITGKKAPETLKKEIIKLTCGHGKLTKLSFEAILAAENLKFGFRDLEDFLLKKSTIQSALREILNQLTPREQNALKTISEAKKPEHVPAYLENAHLVANGKITIPLFETFVRQTALNQTEKITYNAETNEIFEGNDSISERLSPSEFRLLRFLIQNANRVCEKDEVISAVWKDTKTQEGVTDQALDQIIYRLRKKIESDPNNPAHLQTIKGRGFKFSS